jgi:hypothetical protein
LEWNTEERSLGFSLAVMFQGVTTCGMCEVGSVTITFGLRNVRMIFSDLQYEYGRPVSAQVSEGTERIAVAFVSDFCS